MVSSCYYIPEEGENKSGENAREGAQQNCLTESGGLARVEGAIDAAVRAGNSAHYAQAHLLPRAGIVVCIEGRVHKRMIR